ncbi:hypothetical protein RHMOL_Rhmol09G0087500 [Rhododendron molle]|uniref:Uncharacterized protein n=1 Tax=Rhododendron molle TaxID=49168 RepID=A0ACC0MD72_RHOML|nr:hypothetical protein RHMOL_Rhmol09G0087500 [Rhododendron molle]
MISIRCWRGGCGPHGWDLLSSLCAQVRPATVRSSQSGEGLSVRRVGLLLLLVMIVAAKDLGLAVSVVVLVSLDPDCFDSHFCRPDPTANLYIWERLAQLNGEAIFSVFCTVMMAGVVSVWGLVWVSRPRFGPGLGV